MSNFNEQLNQYINAIDQLSPLNESAKDYTLDDYIRNFFAIISEISNDLGAKDIPKLKGFTTDTELLALLNKLENHFDAIKADIFNSKVRYDNNTKGAMLVNIDGEKTRLKKTNLMFIRAIENLD